MAEITGKRVRPRLRRALLGYCRPQVDVVMADFLEEMELLEQGVRRSERELAEAWKEAAAAGERTDAAVEALALATREVEEARRRAEEEGGRIRALAEEAAEGIRRKALRDADRVRKETARLAGIRDDVRQSLNTALERAQGIVGLSEHAALDAPVKAEVVAAEETPPATERASDPAEQASAEDEKTHAVDVDELVRIGVERLGDLGPNGAGPNGHGRLLIEVGPLADFARLTRFQDLTSEVAGERVEIERFSEGRATLSMPGADAGEVLRALEERPDLEFSVRTRVGDRIVLDLDEE